MNELTNIFNKLNKSDTYTEIAQRAGVSRNTIRNVRIRPESARLGTLRKIFDAMGYDLILSLKKRP